LTAPHAYDRNRFGKQVNAFSIRYDPAHAYPEAKVRGPCVVVIMEGSTLGDGKHFQKQRSPMPIGPKAFLSRRAASRRRWRHFCPSRGRHLNFSYWFMRTLDHLCRGCKKFREVGAETLIEAQAFEELIDDRQRAAILTRPDLAAQAEIRR
jgi:hypothetical protein